MNTETMHNKRVLVTGGAGFIGSHLVGMLLDTHNEVVVLDDFSSGGPEMLADYAQHANLTVVRGSVLDPPLLERLCQGVSHLFHLATRNVRMSLRQPTIVYDVNSTGTFNVLKAAAASSVQRLLYCSSSEVNGTADVVPMPEEYNYRPETVYGASKLAGEYYAQVFHRSGWLPVTIARPHNNYGPREHWQGVKGEVIPRFILWALAGEPLCIHGDGRQTRDFTYVTETAATLIQLMVCDHALGQVVNVCRGEESSVRRIAEIIVALVGGGKIAHVAARPHDVLQLYGDNSRLQQLLGHTPQMDIEQGLRLTVEWFKAHCPPTPERLRCILPETWGRQPQEPWLEKCLLEKQHG